jgi:hypothetical protein
MARVDTVNFERFRRPVTGLSQELFPLGFLLGRITKARKLSLFLFRQPPHAVRPRQHDASNNRRPLTAGLDITVAVNGVTVTTTKLKEQPDQIRRAIRATLQGTTYFKKNRSEMVPFIARKLAVDTKEAEELFDLGVKVFSSNGKISDDGLSVLLRQRDPKRQARVKPSDLVDWSLLPTTLE